MIHRVGTFYVFIVLLISAAFALPAGAQEPVQPKRSLSPAQLSAMKQVQSDTENRAKQYAIELATIAKEIFANMLADKEDQRLRRKLNNRLHGAAGHLLDLKGRSFREMLAILTPEQKQLVRTEIAKPGAPTDIGDVIKRLFDIPDK